MGRRLTMTKKQALILMVAFFAAILTIWTLGTLVAVLY